MSPATYARLLESVINEMDLMRAWYAAATSLLFPGKAPFGAPAMLPVPA